MKHHTIRKHLRSLKAWRSIRRTAKHSATFAWHLLRQALGLLRWLHPGRYIKRMDWYIIKKFIGTYIYSIVLIVMMLYNWAPNMIAFRKKMANRFSKKKEVA